MNVTLYHNPRCSKSRAVLELIQAAGYTPHVIEYLATPLSRSQLQELVVRLQVPVRALLRDGEEIYSELGLGDPALHDDALLDAIAQHPILLNRPIVVTPLGGRLCRPPELAAEVLPPSHAG